MNDEDDMKPEAEDETPKRRGGWPKKVVEDDAPEETVDSVMVSVKMIRAKQFKDKPKTKRGQMVSLSLRQARQCVDEGTAVWADPRPDLK